MQACAACQPGGVQRSWSWRWRALHACRTRGFVQVPARGIGTAWISQRAPTSWCDRCSGATCSPSPLLLSPAPHAGCPGARVPCRRPCAIRRATVRWARRDARWRARTHAPTHVCASLCAAAAAAGRPSARAPGRRPGRRSTRPVLVAARCSSLSRRPRARLVRNPRSCRIRSNRRRGPRRRHRRMHHSLRLRHSSRCLRCNSNGSSLLSARTPARRRLCRKSRINSSSRSSINRRRRRHRPSRRNRGRSTGRRLSQRGPVRGHGVWRHPRRSARPCLPLLLE